MNKLLKNIIISASAIALLTGCGPIVEIPTAHLGKINTKAGLQEGLISPSTIRLNAAIMPNSVPDRLILIEASDEQIKETMKLFMPKDKLNLTIEVRGTISISPNKQNVEKIFSRITPEAKTERVSRIDAAKVYEVYGQNIVREIVRTVVSKYTIDFIMSNREALGIELSKEINTALNETPLVFSQFGLADLQPPDIIVTAQEAAKEREVAISKAEAQKLVDLQQADAALAVAKKRQEVELLEAETQFLIDKKLAEGVNQAYITQRALQVWERISTNNAKTVILMPAEAFKNPAMMIGALNQIDK